MSKQQENLNKIYIWLVKNRYVRKKSELAKRIGMTPSNLSRLLNDGQRASEDTVVKFNEAFGNIFNIEYLLGISDDMFPPQTQEKPESTVPEAPSSDYTTIIDLYATLIKEVEGIRRDLKDELAQVRLLRQQLAEQTSHLSHLIGKNYHPLPDVSSTAAEPQTN